MCFSPEASFSLAGALTVAGAYCIRVARRVDRAFLPIAIIPLVFAIQQFCEGWVWIGIRGAHPRLAMAAGMAYLFFALLFWPAWIPYSTLLAERSGKTRWFLRGMTLVGLGLGLGLMLPIVMDPSAVAVHVHERSLHYNISRVPIFDRIPNVLWEGLYLATVATPLFVASGKKLVHLGLAVILSAATTHIFFDHAFASVWCFFAAVLSLGLCVMFRRAAPRDHARSAAT